MAPKQSKRQKSLDQPKKPKTFTITVFRKLWKSINQRLSLFVMRWMSHIRRNFKKKNNRSEYVDQPAVNSDADEVLPITDILKEMSDRQSLLAEDMRKKKISLDLLHNIQNELQKELKIKPVYSNPKSKEEEIIDITTSTTRKLGLFNNVFNEKDLQFMLEIGWKLAQYKIGLPQKLEADERYMSIKTELVKQTATISSEKINNALTAYLSFSFGMNSGYLFYSYLSANSKIKKFSQQKISLSRIKHTRDAGLELLQGHIQRLVGDDSKALMPHKAL